MATKTITGTYSGYYLSGNYNTLIIAQSAEVDGMGVSAAQQSPVTITNLGLVDCSVGDYNGIYLQHGGTIVNGSSSNTSAKIEATTPIDLIGTYSRVTNYASIVSDPVGDSTGPSITMTAGGKVNNVGSSASISNGISISGGLGRVNNTGTIGAPSYDNPGNEINSTSSSIVMSDGGSVFNGSNTNTNANITSGISISGAVGYLQNSGSIGGPKYVTEESPYDGKLSASVSFLEGGSVVNGSAKDTSASINNGINISGGAGTVSNFGKIDSPFTYSTYTGPGSYGAYKTDAAVVLANGGSVYNATSGIISGISVQSGLADITNLGKIDATEYFGGPPNISYYAAISLADGGTITNGSAGDIVGISITGGSTQIQNDGTIGAPSSTSYQDTSTYFSITMAGFGAITNGSASDKAASISNGVSLYDGASTLTNFGTIGADSAGVAVMLGEADETLVEEGTGALNGTVTGTGSTLLLAGDAGAGTIGGFGSTITGFALIDVVKGATWKITGAVTVAASEEFAVDGTATFTSVVKNDGNFRVKGSAVLGSGGSFTNEADGTMTFAASGASFTGSITSYGDIVVEGPLTLRQSSVLVLKAGTTLSLQGAASITGGTIESAGTISKTLAGTAIVRSNNELDTITISTGTLQFSATSTDISGAVSGKGTLAFGRGTSTIDGDTTIKTNALTVGGNGANLVFATSIYFAQQFAATGGAVLTFDSGTSLTTAGSASFASTMFAGTGHLTTKGSVIASYMTFGGTSYWLNYSTVTETGTTTLGAGTSLTNASGATFSLAGDVGIAETGSAKISNAGHLIKTAGSGTSTIAGAVVNTGSIEAKTGILDITGAVTGTGTLLVDAGATLEFDAAVASGQTASFSSASGTMKLGDAHDFAGTIAKFNAGDTLDLAGFATPGTTVTFIENGAGTSGLLKLTDGSKSATLTLSGNHSTHFHLKSDGHGGTIVSYGAGGVAMASPAPDRHVADLADALFEGTFAPSGWTAASHGLTDDPAFALGAAHEHGTTIAHR